MDIYSTANSAGMVDYFVAPTFQQAKGIAQQIVGRRCLYVAIVTPTNPKYHKVKKYLGL